jgi:16S rRNA (guanine(966)-N(2))-methyltransferase RsmD
MNKYIRIVAGQYRRTPIEVIEAQGLRPTPDRVRETLFNWLNYFWSGQFKGKQVLDLFAGSGALGFEAASRGVSHVDMVENNTRAATALKALRDKLRADMVNIHVGDAQMVLERMKNPKFDLIFLDPPFGADWITKLWPLLPNLLEPNGIVYIEAENTVSCPEGFSLLRQERAGVVHYHLFQIAALQK